MAYIDNTYTVDASGMWTDDWRASISQRVFEQQRTLQISIDAMLHNKDTTKLLKTIIFINEPDSNVSARNPGKLSMLLI